MHHLVVPELTRNADIKLKTRVSLQLIQTGIACRLVAQDLSPKRKSTKGIPNTVSCEGLRAARLRASKSAVTTQVGADCSPDSGTKWRDPILNPGTSTLLRGVMHMRTSPSIVPRDDDQDIYLVMDDFGGRLGLVWRETGPDSTDFEIVIRDLLDGQYSNPVRVVGFNTAEGWSRDVSEDVANELRRRCDLELRELPLNIQEFVERFEDRRQFEFKLG